MDNGREYSDVKLRPSRVAHGLWALLVYDEEEPVRAVERILLDQGLSTRRVRNCSAARAVLREAAPPVLVLTDVSLPDGNWADVLKATCAASPGPPVIVVSRLVDMKLYLDVLESGAYDFVVPPLTAAGLVYIVRGAMLKGSRRQPQSEANRWSRESVN
jgi:DNA-binding NtrC family response regulator